MADISKLPKWAQAHIHDIQRQRDVAVNALQQWSDHQTPAPFSIDEILCTETPPVHMTRYVQGHRMTVTHAGIELNLLLRDDAIEISYSTEGRARDVMLRPYSYHRLQLRAITEESNNG